MPIILLLNSSFVFHKYINAATNAAITAIIAANAPKETPSAPETALKLAGNLEIMEIIDPTEEIVLPSTIRTGPRAAAINAILMMVSLVCGSS